jgi:hypothetical protein
MAGPRSIFEDMHRSRSFGGWRDYNELLRMLGEAIERGHVNEIQPGSVGRDARIERWFVEKETSVVFRLIEPDPPAAGDWSEVEFPDWPTQ